MDSVVSVDHIVKIKESEMIEKYLNFIRKMEKTVKNAGDSDTNNSWCTWKVPIGFEQLEIEGKMETIQTTALLRSA